MPASLEAPPENRFRASTYLQALHLFMSIFYSVFIHETKRRPHKAASLGEWLTERRVRNHPRYQELLRAHIVDVFRNKLLAHHDVYRHPGAMGDGRGLYRISAMPAEPSRHQELEDRILALNRRAIPWGLPHEKNPPTVLQHLFLSTPLPQKWIPRKELLTLSDLDKSEREAVDDMVEVYGADSLTLDEMLASIRPFCEIAIDLGKFPKPSQVP